MLYDKRWEAPTVPVELEPWRRLLLDAADLLETHKWCQGSLARGNAVCAVGSVYLAHFGDRETVVEWSVHPAVTEAIEMVARHIGTEVAEWNDRSGRTKAQVIAMFREVANGRLNDAL